ncbi:MAG: radical SAM protein [Phycisphaerae bacterium]
MARYACPPPDLVETRAGRTLHVWGDVPYWLVADKELTDALAVLQHEQPLRTAAETLAVRSKRSARNVLKDLRPILRSLYKAGVLRKNGRTARRHPPRQARLEVVCINLTNRCNLRCIFCFNDASRTQAGDELSADEILRFLKDLRPYLARRPMLAFMGGEPLLARNRLLAVARGAGRRWEKLVSTNGLLVDDAFAIAARTAGLEVQVSIDGAQASSHDRVRGKETFSRATDAVGRLAGAGVHTIISMVAHRDNQGEIGAYLDLALRLGASEARVIPLKRVGAGRDAGLQMPDFRRILLDTVAAVREWPERQRLLGRDYLCLLAQTCAHSYRRTTCGTASQTILLDADGTVYPCQNHCAPELAAGNIRRERFRDLWKGEALSRLRDMYHVDRRAACAECPVRYWCMGGCRGEAYSVSGRFDAPSATCEMNRDAILEVLWLLAERPDLAGPRRGHY